MAVTTDLTWLSEILVSPKTASWKAFPTSRYGNFILWLQNAGVKFKLSFFFTPYILFLRVCVCAKSLQLYQTVCNPVDHSPPGSSVHGILQERIVEWVAMPSFKGSSTPGNEPASLTTPVLRVSFFTTTATGKPLRNSVCSAFRNISGIWYFSPLLPPNLNHYHHLLQLSL